MTLGLRAWPSLRPCPLKHRNSPSACTNGVLYLKTEVQLFRCTSVGVLPMYIAEGVTMPVVAIVNQKGGTGKTTLSINLSSAFAEIYPTLLLDADPQGSALDWADSRSTTRQMNLDALGVEPSHLLRDIRRLAPNYGWIIIDGPARHRTNQCGRRSSGGHRADTKQAQPLRCMGFSGHRGGGQGSTGNKPAELQKRSSSSLCRGPAPDWSPRLTRHLPNTGFPCCKPARLSGSPTL